MYFWHTFPCGKLVGFEIVIFEFRMNTVAGGKFSLECLERITKVIFFSMKEYKLFTFHLSKTHKQWFNSSCFRATH